MLASRKRPSEVPKERAVEWGKDGPGTGNPRKRIAMPAHGVGERDNNEEESKSTNMS